MLLVRGSGVQGTTRGPFSPERLCRRQRGDGQLSDGLRWYDQPGRGYRSPIRREDSFLKFISPLLMTRRSSIGRETTRAGNTVRRFFIRTKSSAVSRKPTYGS